MVFWRFPGPKTNLFGVFRLLLLVIQMTNIDLNAIWAIISNTKFCQNMTAPPPPSLHTHTVAKIVGLRGLQYGHQWQCSKSAKIWAMNLWYHTKCVSDRLYHNTKFWKWWGFLHIIKATFENLSKTRKWPAKQSAFIFWIFNLLADIWPYSNFYLES